MKIDYVIVSTDNNPLYDGYWELVKKSWNEIINVTPILVVIGDENYHHIYDDCEIIGYKKVDNIPTSLQSQISRLYATKTYLNKTFLTSDLDMLPLSKSYFVENAKMVDENSLLIYTADAYGYSNQIRYPMCYNLAKGSVYNEIMNLDDSFQDFVVRLYNLKITPLWDTDELFWGSCVSEFEKKPENVERLVKLHRGFAEGYATNRIDRMCWFTTNYDFLKVPHNFYIDSHLLRPYNEYEKEINYLINLLYKQK